MSKKQFIQQQVIHHDPATPGEVKARVQKAEKVYEILTELGYGAPKQTNLQETRNYYQDLTGYQKEWFDKFWIAFDYKQGRNRAALAWIKLKELSVEEYKNIVAAAKAEALKPRKQHETRKMAEGWLTEFRFQDHQAESQNSGENNARKLALNSELIALKQFNSDGSQDDAIIKIKAELAAL